MQLTQILTSLGASVLIFSFMNPALGQTNAPNKADEVILEMSQAFKKNDKAQLSRLLPKARGHTLEPWAAYWELRVRLDQASDSEIQQFLTQYAGTYAEDRLRNDWLLQLFSEHCSYSVIHCCSYAVPIAVIQLARKFNTTSQ